MEQKSKFLVTNLCWAIGCLLAIVIALISTKSAKSPEFVNIISVALSLASLLLAIIAIFQTLISNGGLNNSISDINSAASNILISSRDLSKFSELFLDKFEKIGEMPDKLEGVRFQLDELNSKTKLSSTPEIPPDEPPTSSADFNMEAAYGRATRGTIVALYAALKANISGIEFEFSQIYDKSVAAYYDGVLAGLKLSGIATITQIDTKFVVHDLGPFKSKEIEGWMRKLTNSKDPKGSKFFQDRRDKIDTFFLTAKQGE